jgi:hypothetical protein
MKAIDHDKDACFVKSIMYILQTSGRGEARISCH